MASVFKILAVGFPHVGKSTFLNGGNFNNLQFYEGNCNIGVSFQIVNLLYEEINFVFQIWDMKSRIEFMNLTPNFFQGVNGTILVFDLSNRLTLDYLPHWIRTIRLVNDSIPLFLVGTKSDLDWQVSLEEIERFVHYYNLMGYSLGSIQNLGFRTKIFQQLAEYFYGKYREIVEHKRLNFLNADPNLRSSSSRMVPNQDANQFSKEHDIKLRAEQLLEIHRLTELIGEFQRGTNYRFKSLSEKEKKEFRSFLIFYSTCPICKKENHGSYLEKFFFSRDSRKKKIKEKLLELMEVERNVNDYGTYQITCGIPCCECFEEFFKDREFCI